MLCRYERTIFKSDKGFCIFSYSTEDQSVPKEARNRSFCCCIVGCQNDKRRVETSGGATGVGGTNPGMPQQRSLRK